MQSNICTCDRFAHEDGRSPAAARTYSRYAIVKRTGSRTCIPQSLLSTPAMHQCCHLLNHPSLAVRMQAACSASDQSKLRMSSQSAQSVRRPAAANRSLPGEAEVRSAARSAPPPCASSPALRRTQCCVGCPARLSWPAGMPSNRQMSFLFATGVHIRQMTSHASVR